MAFRGVTGSEIILRQLPGRSTSREVGLEGGGREGWGGDVGRGSYIRDLNISTEGAVTACAGRLFHSLMVRGRRTPSCKRSCKQEVGMSPDGTGGWLLL